MTIYRADKGGVNEKPTSERHSQPPKPMNITIKDMEIYVVEKYDTFSESSNVYSAYEDEDDANIEAERLNEEEKVKEKIYDKWLLNGDDDSLPPESGENVFTVVKTILHKI